MQGPHLFSFENGSDLILRTHANLRAQCAGSSFYIFMCRCFLVQVLPIPCTVFVWSWCRVCSQSFVRRFSFRLSILSIKKRWVLVGTGRYTVLAKHHGGSPVMFHSEIVIFHISIVIFHISGGVPAKTGTPFFQQKRARQFCNLGPEHSQGPLALSIHLARRPYQLPSTFHQVLRPYI